MLPRPSPRVIGALATTVAVAGLVAGQVTAGDDEQPVVASAAELAPLDTITTTSMTAPSTSVDLPVATTTSTTTGEGAARPRAPRRTTTTAGTAPTTTTVPDVACPGEAPTLEGAGVWIVRDGAATKVLDRRAEDMSWSRDGHYLAASLDVGGELALHIVDTATGRSTHVTTESNLAEPAWTADGRLLVVTGDEVRAVSPATGTGTLLHRGNAGVMAVAAGTNMAIVRDASQLFSIDLRTAQSTVITATPGMSTPIALSPDDRHIAYTESPPYDPTTIRTMAIDGSDVVDHGEVMAAHSAAWTADSARVIWDVARETAPGNGSPEVWSTSPMEGDHAVVSERAFGSMLLSSGAVVFQDADTMSVVRADVSGGDRRVLAESAMDPAAGGSTIAYRVDGGVCATDASGSASHRVAAAVRSTMVAVAPDGTVAVTAV